VVVVPILQRQREPRENSDFLRVVVLEMNMRREGKLEDTVQGRARIWLPPRRMAGVACSASGTSASGGGGDDEEVEADERIPRRWRGVLVNEV